MQVKQRHMVRIGQVLQIRIDSINYRRDPCSQERTIVNRFCSWGERVIKYVDEQNRDVAERQIGQSGIHTLCNLCDVVIDLGCGPGPLKDARKGRAGNRKIGVPNHQDRMAHIALCDLSQDARRLTLCLQAT